MDSNFYMFAKNLRDRQAAEHNVRKYSTEVLGSGKTQDSKQVNGLDAGAAMKREPKKRAQPIDFAGSGKERLAVRPKSKSIKPDVPKNQRAGPSGHNAFPKEPFTDRISKPPDGLYKTGSVQSNVGWVPKDSIPLLMNEPPLRVKGQSMYPIGKKQTEIAWRKLMGAGGARTQKITANTAENTPAAPVAPAPPVPVPTTTVDTGSSTEPVGGDAMGQEMDAAMVQIKSHKAAYTTHEWKLMQAIIDDPGVGPIKGLEVAQEFRKIKAKATADAKTRSGKTGRDALNFLEKKMKAWGIKVKVAAIPKGRGRK